MVHGTGEIPPDFYDAKEPLWNMAAAWLAHAEKKFLKGTQFDPQLSRMKGLLVVQFFVFPVFRGFLCTSRKL